MWATPAGQRWNTELTSNEAADLFAYMYSVLYFAPAGDVARGRDTVEKNCAVCHSDTPVAGAAGSPISTWAAVKDPVVWAGRMWNHAPEMNKEVLAKARPWPRLSGQDVADLMVYLRSLPVLRAKSSTFAMGEPEQGQPVFERSCESCHSFGPGAGKTFDLLRRSAPQTVTGYIAAMWNHAPLMQRDEVRWQLDPEDMPDLIAFLFSQSYFFERGDAGRGRRVFTNENCARCHEQLRKQTGAPDLTQSTELYSPITLISAVSRHTPAMFEAGRARAVSWPQFQGSEMADLIAYLNSRVIVRIAPKTQDGRNE
jgi:mono/diheme cytochrome c family protein